MKDSDKKWLGRKIHLEAEVERGFAKWRNELAVNRHNSPDHRLKDREIQDYVYQAYTHESLATALDRLAERIEQS